MIRIQEMVWLPKAVSLVGVGHIFIDLPCTFERGNEFLRLLRWHLWVLFAMHDE